MLQMSQYYEPEFKKKIVRLHLEEGRSLKGLAEEYGVSKASIWKVELYLYLHHAIPPFPFSFDSMAFSDCPKTFVDAQKAAA